MQFGYAKMQRVILQLYVVDVPIILLYLWLCVSVALAWKKKSGCACPLVEVIFYCNLGRFGASVLSIVRSREVILKSEVYKCTIYMAGSVGTRNLSVIRVYIHVA